MPALIHPAGRQPGRARLLALLSVVALPLVAHGATFTWKGGALPLPTQWSNPINWLPVGSPSGLAFNDQIVFPGAFAESTNDVRANFLFESLRAFVVTPVATTGTIAGLSLRPSGIAPQIEVGNGVLSLTAALSGATTFDKTGAGTLTLAGNNAGYTGRINVVAGTLAASAPGALGAANRVDIATGATLEILNTLAFGGVSGSGTMRVVGDATIGVDDASGTFAGRLSGAFGAAGLTKAGTGALALSSRSTDWFGRLTVAAGTLALTATDALSNASQVRVDAGSELQLQTSQSLRALTSEGVLNIIGGLTLGEGGRDSVLAGSMLGPGLLEKVGSGNLRLAGDASQFAGRIAIHDGTVTAASPGAAGTAQVSISSSGRLVVASAGSFGSIAGSGQLVLDASAGVGRDDGSFTFAGTISGAGNLLKQGTGTLTFSGIASHTGVTTVSGGTFALSGTQASVAGGSGLDVQAALLISGPGSRWTTSGTIRVDGPGSGARMQIESGAMLSGDSAIVGAATASALGAAANGDLARWHLGGDLIVDPSAGRRTGPTTVVVGTGGEVRVGGRLHIHDGGRVVLDGGALIARELLVYANGELDWRQGTLGTVFVTLGSSRWAPRSMRLGPGQTLDAGLLEIGNGALTLAGGHAQAERIEIDGGTVTGDAWNLARTGSLVGFGTISARIASTAPRNRIWATGGTLTVGDPNASDGFSFAGTLESGLDSRLLLRSASRATLGASTVLFPGGSLASLNGLLLAPGSTLTSLGRSSVLGTFTNQGSVHGPNEVDATLAFTDRVDGGGSFTGNIRFEQVHSPGESPGIVSLEHVEYGPGATLVIELFGPAPGTHHDRVDVSGKAVLAGVLDVRFLGGYAPPMGASFVVLTFGTRAGAFTSLHVSGLDASLRLVAGFGDHDLTITVTAVPEPHEWLLMLAGLGCVIGWARRAKAG